jgi:asparagine synthase (glutamine-hydrolysing)
MSVQFGKWNFEGQPPSPGYMEKVNAILAPYGPDSKEAYSERGLNILYRAFHTTKEARREAQPCISASGGVLTWDGRLDNRADLISALQDSLTISSTDVTIVAAAYEKWGTGCFAKLIGDWALSIWNPINHSLLLAKDPIGIRKMYYSFDDSQVTWSTILDPLVLLAGKTFKINEEYIAGWFLMHPANHLTPYVGIHSVPASSFVLLQPGKHIVNEFWDFDPGKRIRYRTDAEYEQHFRTVFAEAIRRRLRSDGPVLADLSGGMDSSSIVCMADTIITSGASETLRLDTISWYDDADPILDERQFFSKVEHKRGRTGWHINLGELRQRESSSQQWSTADFARDRFAATPSASNPHGEFFNQYRTCIVSQGYRVVLAGIAGDDVMGSGVPTPAPELQNLLARAHFITLSHRVNAWAVKMRKPRLALLWEAVRGFLTLSPAGLGFPGDLDAVPLFDPGFVFRNQAALRGYPTRVSLFGPLPSFQIQVATLRALRRIVASCVSRPEMLAERRYPYLDRCLLEFMFAIPREQIVRVGQRRSLMKRSLSGIVPDEVLSRRQKADVLPQRQQSSLAALPSLAEIGQDMVSSSLRIINPDLFLGAQQKARCSQEGPVRILRCAMTLEAWLRHLTIHGVLTTGAVTMRRRHAWSLKAEKLETASRSESSASKLST